jgi:hypothetical protein
MIDLWLIAHKVHNEPAFDIAARMECPECSHMGDGDCPECDALGFWWIIPTSGHRAYPWWNLTLEQVSRQSTFVYCEDDLWKGIPAMPPTLPDHYHHTASPSEVRDRLASLLASLPPAPTVPFKRRF